MRVWMGIGVVAVGLGAWLLLVEPDLVEVKTEQIQLGLVEYTVANTRAGSVKACRRSGLSMPMGGRVEKLYVDEGDHVEQGQLLLELWNQDALARVSQAKATFRATAHRREQRCVESDNALREATRMDALYERGLASVETREAARTRASSANFSCEASRNDEEVAAAALTLAQALLDETQLKAPFAGVVAEITGEVGEFVTPSPPGIPTPPAIDLIDYSCLYVTVPIDEIDAGRLQVGLPARVSLDAYRGQFFAATVSRIAPYVQEFEKQARTVDIEVTLDIPSDQQSLLVGYSADVDVVLEAHDQVLRLPTDALLEDKWVWRVTSEGYLERADLELGLRNWHFVEILDGVAQGDQIVVSLDVPGLAGGVRVSVVNDPT